MHNKRIFINNNSADIENLPIFKNLIFEDGHFLEVGEIYKFNKRRLKVDLIEELGKITNIYLRDLNSQRD